MAKKRKNKYPSSKYVGYTLLSLIAGLVVGLMGSVGYTLTDVKSDEKKKSSGVGKIYDDFQIHFMELGNIYAGDSIYIKAGDNDILIDAGSRPSSKETIKNYLNNYVEDGKLEYVIATHAHQDHIASFGCSEGIFYSYDIGTIIDFPLTNSTTSTYKKYVEGKEYAISKGSSYYSALDCINETNGAKKVYTLGEDITMEVLDSRYYVETTKDENDYSVCLLFTCGKNKFLLTGDLEEDGEKYLVELNKDKISNCDLFKAGHHGSYTASSEALLKVVQPKISVCTCVCGSTEYTKNLENVFPSQKYVDRISKYTDQVFVTSLCSDYEKGEYTSMNGNVIVSSNKIECAVNCSSNNTILKDTTWFKENRNCPEGWK